MTNVTTINQTEITRRKAALETALQELVSNLTPREELEIEHLADPLDQIKSNADREIVMQRLDGQVRRSQEIRFALGRIEDGTYGSCEQCEEAIGKRRLDALPWARLCVTCQSRQESEERTSHVAFDAAA